MNNLLPLPVLLPLLAAGLTLALNRRPRAQRLVATLALAGVTTVAGFLVRLTDVHGPLVLWVGNWPQPLGIALVADRLSALMLLVSSVVTLAVLLFSMGAPEAERRRETPVSIFYPTFLVLSAGVSNAFLAGDLFNLFVGFEMLLFASYVLLTLGGTGARVRAGSTYVLVSLLSSTLFLITIAAVYAATGTVNLAQLSLRLRDLPPDVALVLQLLLLTVFSIKAAVFPMSAWLPDSYPTAPAPVTAVFAGLLTKVGVYAIIRTQTLLFGDSHLTTLLPVGRADHHGRGDPGGRRPDGGQADAVLHPGQPHRLHDLRRRAREHRRLRGAIFYTAHHITIQTTLFLVVGLVEIRAGSTSLTRLGGLAALSPVLGILFFVPAMNLAGIPPFSGFIGKVGLLDAGVQHGGFLAYLLVGGGVVTSLLTLYAMAKVWNRAFWRPLRAEADAADPADPSPEAATPGAASVDEGDEDADDLPRGRRLPWPMVATTVVLVLAGVGLTVVAGPLYGYAQRSAADLVAVTPYVRAVLPGGTR